MSQTLSATTPAHGADVRSAATLPDADYQASERTLAKAFRRILPFIFACYVISYLDRTNVGFAALTMNKDIGLTAEQFGFGAGLFFIGYFLFEIPSNLIMQKVGARIWIARIMITWGIFSMATAFVVGPKSFAAARFLLGLAEAGFTPGIYLYFTHWFPGKWRAKVTAAFLVGIPVANMIGSPISGALLELGGLHGLRSWQWLLLVEGLPAVLLGIACLFVLADRPEKAKWLTDDEKAVLARRLAMEQRAIASKHGTTLRDAMTNWRVFVLAFINFCGIVGSIGVGLWMPQIIKQFGVEHTVVGWLTAIPYALGAVVMLWWARMANRAQNRVPYVAAALVIAAVALAASTALDAPALKLAALCLTVSGILAFQATFWAIPSTFLTGRAAAGGLALIVSVGNLGGFVGPSMVGAIKQFSQGFTAPLLAVSAVLLIGALSIAWLGDPGADAGEAATR
ncbi:MULTISPECIES: MFS transporter [Ralstonia]|jgi:MFS transporter, ACS family, tartrate transporter|uniref:Tartrate transporter n=1 Tax=Ralstonia pickettii TaxID=329 RepID=A0ABM9IJ96_RALPI|nr:MULTISPECIES: MFS transporter [Ralstonia]MBA4202801.1 MFS transporter [Ralstonia sp.]MBA4230559.1 MFS transporter [Ralstonia sp.]MBA4235298.1 MFS transporter [Ralstonia sp.]MBA4280394.1 MFS transporter [Ralstonia sp.]MBA4296529.1 MFS transporter [Ralstonia sp.]